MRQPSPVEPLTRPALLPQAETLAAYLRTLSAGQLAAVMKISPALAAKTHQTYAAWTSEASRQTAAMDSFVGDIYSGLRATELSPADRLYAQEHLRILSGLYGVLRPLDGISPYRLEMAYKLPDEPYRNLYRFWGDQVAAQIASEVPILNLAAVEYSKLVMPFVDERRVITPRFLTINPKTHEPAFVVVHAKIARGAFARWVMQHRIEEAAALHNFADIGYRYAPHLSSPQEPVFICQEFGGKGLSMRLS